MSSAAATKLKQLVEANKVLVLSKTSCPYCSRTKALLSELNAKNVKVVELDRESDGSDLQSAAASLTGQRTVPNIFIGQKHIGGNDRLQALHRQGELVGLLKAAASL